MVYLYDACDQISDFCHQQLLTKMRRKISWTDGRTDSGKTVYPPPPPGSGGINTTTVPAEGNSSKRPIVFNNCQVTNNKKKNIPENDKRRL